MERFLSDVTALWHESKWKFFGILCVMLGVLITPFFLIGTLNYIIFICLGFALYGAKIAYKMLRDAVKFTYDLLNWYRDEWQEFKQDTAFLYGPVPKYFYLGQEFVEPKWNLRQVTLTGGYKWRFNYCVKKRVVGFMDPGDFKTWPGRLSPIPIFETVETFTLPEIGKHTKVPYLRDVSA